MAKQLNYKEISLMANMPIRRVKEEFGNVVEALYDRGYLKDDSKIPSYLVDAYLFGSPIWEQRRILDILGAYNFFRNEHKLDNRTIENIVNGDAPIDYWVLIKTLANYYLGEGLPSEYSKYVEFPLQDMLEGMHKIAIEAKEEYNKVLKIFKKIANTLEKDVAKIEIDKMKIIRYDYFLYQDLEIIKNKLNQVIETMNKSHPLAIN